MCSFIRVRHLPSICVPHCASFLFASLSVLSCVLDRSLVSQQRPSQSLAVAPPSHPRLVVLFPDVPVTFDSLLVSLWLSCWIRIIKRIQWNTHGLMISVVHFVLHICLSHSLSLTHTLSFHAHTYIHMTHHTSYLTMFHSLTHRHILSISLSLSLSHTHTQTHT